MLGPVGVGLYIVNRLVAGWMGTLKVEEVRGYAARSGSGVIRSDPLLRGDVLLTRVEQFFDGGLDDLGTFRFVGGGHHPVEGTALSISQGDFRYGSSTVVQ
jgi:hypothetical protein